MSQVARNTFSQLESLFRRRQVGVKFSLEGMLRLCAALDHPEKDLHFVHIAGTNGKGSVAAMCNAIFQEAGFRTGLYTSPHLWRYHERFRINGEEIEDDALEKWLDRLMRVANGATFFEISTALALGYFRERQVQMVLWETGMGGRLDATNVVTPLVSVITPIGLEHMQFLGNTLAEITREKTGIIKPFVPVVTSFSQVEEVFIILKRKADEQKAPLNIVGEADLYEFEPPLMGEHQRWNTALAVATSRLVHPLLTSAIIRRGLSRTQWPGRCQLVKRGNDLPPILVDGAHNPMGAQVLVQEVERCWGRRQTTLIFGVLADKAIAEMARILKDMAAEIFLTPVSSERSADISELSRQFPKGRVFPSLVEALSVADASQRPIVIAGSLFLAAEALLLLSGKSRRLHPNEQLHF